VPAVLLSHYLAHIYLAQRPGLSASYCRLLAATVRRLDVFAGRPLAMADVDRELLGRWAAEALGGDLRPATINDRLRMVRTLLLAAYDDGLLDRPPRRNRRLAENHAPPEAWTIIECRRLFAHLAELPGHVGELPADQWWTSLCLTAYWSGCRIGALLRSRAADYQPGGLTVRRQKNGRQQWYPLPAACCEAIERVVPSAGVIWPWRSHRSTFFGHFRRHIEAAGLPAPRTHCQLFHRLRRTTLSYCAAVDPAIAQRQADHADPRTTARHYIDPRIARGRSAIDVLPDPLTTPPTLPEPTVFRVVG